ncbi:MAG: hypothetical protein NXY57DRAFT_963636 [Lentinula lateritia]|nr:MAG: hypothetical protein NXY57DRAFT_963636 [Lentinula lateritia]
MDLAVLAYEILINLGREVDLVWSANFRWSNVIYYMNRYPVVVFQVWELCYKTSTPQLFWYTSFIPTRAAITASFALRVYAIMDGRLLFVVILSALGVAIVGLDVQGSSTILNNFMLILSSIMVSRFLLDLQEINETQANGETTITTGTIAFATGTTTEPSQALLPPCCRGVSDR